MSVLKPIRSDVTSVDIALTIVISCYNTRDLVRDCLRSIYEIPPREPYEIVLVDDAGRDGTSEMVREMFPEVILLRNEVNKHYSYSNNRAIDQARGRNVLLLNNDTIVLPNALDAMIAFLQAHPEAGAVGCKLLNEDGTIQASAKSALRPATAVFGAQSLLTRLFPGNFLSRRHVLHLGRDMNQPIVAGYVSGAASMMPLKIMQEIGPLDETLFYHVDADYCKRIWDAGYKCYYLPTVAITHLNHKGGTMSSPLARLRSLMMFEVYSYRYYRKHFPRARWSPALGFVATGLFLHFIGLASGQALAEIATLARWTARPKKVNELTVDPPK